ncbi:hypothetical protein H2200_002678 [Cladophialophora chaetospira]|uniref:Amidase domain-containing protein n=1 Tax=Cladophialophora chaetospira TaxID=386627 RepID=A0AA39CMB9_9EURO|nr:hypothetical protein H2200_002678 [Cladophialophora chaetospira]
MLPRESELYRLTASEVTNHLRLGDLTVEAYVRSLLSRIEAREPLVKAWAYVDPALIISQAQQLDQVPPHLRGLLHGIPIGVKDVIYTIDMPTKHNSPIHEGSETRLDAAVVTILRKAGALIFGKTATAQFAAIHDGPATRNPHDLTRTPGGSSSGSAAAVADFHIPIALGTQTAGSIVRPAAFCGVYGMKPTWGAVSLEGVKLVSGILDTIGIFARSVEDLQLMADIFQCRDDIIPQSIDIKTSRFGILKTAMWKHAQPATVKSLEAAAQLLESQGASVKEITLPSDFNDLHLWQQQTMYTDIAVTHYSNYLTAKDKLPASLIGHVENGQRHTHSTKLNAMDSIARLRPVIDEILSRYTAVLTPSTTGEAPVGFYTGYPVFNTFWTALHTPVINLPGFGGQEGLPVGLSIVTSRYRDQHLLKVAKELGPLFQSRGGWQSSL